MSGYSVLSFPLCWSLFTSMCPEIFRCNNITNLVPQLEVFSFLGPPWPTLVLVTELLEQKAILNFKFLLTLPNWQFDYYKELVVVGCVFPQQGTFLTKGVRYEPNGQLVCWDGVWLIFCPCWSWTLISTSWVGGITALSHCGQPEIIFFT
jgi:hypothetical protein